ncbi:CsgG/HfaB family protein, partial [Falsiroseomonas sp.]|uniref:CsgG/HfaB family protein n=1 Tax=Falsiroseomonas sp. TaxID=2870721 RepID=UPI003F712A71
MSEALTCMRSQLARQEDIRIGIADLVDGTGASLGEGDNAGRMVTQRPDLMLLVAMSRAGARLVNRTSIGVVEWEMREAMARRLGEGREARVGDTTFPFRPVRVGEIVGSSFYVSGAVTEYNYNIYSDVQEAGIFGVTAGRRSYRVSVAVDLVVTRSTTTEVRLARSYGKQLVGQEVGVGVFRFLDMSVGNTRTELFEANIGQRQNEPVQAALRWVIETGAYDILSELFGRSEACDRLVPGYDPGSNAREAGDPRRPSSPAAVPGATPGAAPAPASPAAPAPADILQFEQTAPGQPVAQQSPPAAQQQSRAAPPDAIPPPPAAARTVVAEQVARPSLMSAIARLFAAAPANDAGTAASPAHNGPAASGTPPSATATAAAATAATPPPATVTAATATAATPPPATVTAATATAATPPP